MKGVFVILDGVADDKLAALDYMTPLEYAHTPNLDELAKVSKIDYCFTLKEGVVPESSSAVVSLLGFDPNFAPRGPLEAMGAGIGLMNGDLALRANFATVDKEGRILDRRCGRTLSTKEAKALAWAVNQKVDLKFPFAFYSTLQHRGVLVFRGGFSDNITGTDPAYGAGVVSAKNYEKILESKELDEDEDSRLSAEMLNYFTSKSREILQNHPINIKRVKKGLFPANAILCRDPGSELISFSKMKGKWIALGYNPLEIGIAKAAKMDIYSFRYPKMKGIDVYSTLEIGLKKAIKNAVKMLKKGKSKYDYFYVHIKETDIPGHDNKPSEKVKMIELLDKRFFSFLRKYCVDGKLVITADHATSCRTKGHTDAPVPVLFYSGYGKVVEENRFSESCAMNGDKILGRELLNKTLFSK